MKTRMTEILQAELSPSKHAGDEVIRLPMAPNDHARCDPAGQVSPLSATLGVLDRPSEIATNRPPFMMKGASCIRRRRSVETADDSG